MASRHSPCPHSPIHTTEEGAGSARRRSLRLHPQIRASQVGAGAARRRSPRLHPHIHAGDTDSAGVTRRRSPRLHPHIHEGDKDGARRRGTSPAAPASLPDDDDMLWEILLRLPPQPSSLPRASAVCKRWRGLVTDPNFHRSFRAHHRKPPLLGVIHDSKQENVFTPVLDRPDSIHPARLSLGHCSNSSAYDLLDCRHGLVLIKHRVSCEVVVCDPVTGEQRRVPVPPEFKTGGYFIGAVLCVDGNQGHVHGDCHSSPFKVVLMKMHTDCNRPPTVCVYSSETGIWGNPISAKVPCRPRGDARIPATMVGNALYWFSRIGGILEFHLDGQSLTVIKGPPVRHNILCGSHRIVRAEDGALGFAVLSFPRLVMWQRNVNGHGVATWVPWKTIDMHTMLGLPSQIHVGSECLVGYGEDNHVIFCLLGYSVYMVELESMRPRKLFEANYATLCHPFMSFYTPGTAINGGSKGPEMLHDT